jgi:2-oxoisovalerate dehydrogenase E1 component alpha subunit
MTELGIRNMTATDQTDAAGPRRVIPLNGEPGPDTEALSITKEDLRQMYRLMAVTRKADLEATALQRQGQLAVYPPLIGQEAAQVGSAFALEESDWIFPSYRELGAAVARGIDLVEYLHFYRATWHGGTYDSNVHRFGMVSVPVASQILHAVGYALGAKMDGHPVTTLAYFGDGATSEGDFHEGCNFAAVFKAPVVFFCQNNQWAISVPLSAQTVAPIWRKAEAYGFPGVQVDGNDVLAVYLATKASKYRDAEEVQRWQALDPLERYRGWLAASGHADDTFFDEVEGEGKDFAAKMRAGVIASDPRPVEELFRWVFADVPPHLARQRDEALRFASANGDAEPSEAEADEGGAGRD